MIKKLNRYIRYHSSVSNKNQRSNVGKVAFVVPKLGRGGAERVVYLLVKEFVKQQVDSLLPR